MERFQYIVDECKFSYLLLAFLILGITRNIYGDENIKVRLDRGLGDDWFLEIFDSTTVKHIQTM
jgi:hypothetical protein